jgi:serine/threonine protein kinase
VRALIQPHFPAEEKKLVQEMRFNSLWIEGELLQNLKGKRGVIELDDRMAFEVDGKKRLYLIEEYYWDGSLIDFLENEGALSSSQQRILFEDLLEGLGAIHSQGILHNDIKADNILLDLQRGENLAVFSDFQLATSPVDLGGIEFLRFLAKWGSPEQSRASLTPGLSEEELLEAQKKTLSVQSDLFCLGVVFYRLIAGESPFWRQFPTDQEGLSALAHLKTGWLPDQLKGSVYFHLLERMLHPDPKKRCTAQEALKLLRTHPI